MVEHGLDRGLVFPSFGPRRQSLVLQFYRPDVEALSDEAVFSIFTEATVLLTRLFPVVESILGGEVEYTSLNDIEHSILSLLASSKQIKTIADTLDISMKSVSNHIKNINEKFGCPSRDESLARASAAGLITVIGKRADDENFLIGL
jgi:DNA-binding CsgD family transcriptional regulator